MPSFCKNCNACTYVCRPLKIKSSLSHSLITLFSYCAFLKLSSSHRLRAATQWMRALRSSTKSSRLNLYKVIPRGARRVTSSRDLIFQCASTASLPVMLSESNERKHLQTQFGHLTQLSHFVRRCLRRPKDLLCMTQAPVQAQTHF
jgi:hypothetical protein